MIAERRRSLEEKHDPERRSTPRLNIGKLNYESMMRVLYHDKPFAQWESLSLLERAAISAAASYVVNRVLSDQQDQSDDV